MCKVGLWIKVATNASITAPIMPTRAAFFSETGMLSSLLRSLKKTFAHHDATRQGPTQSYCKGTSMQDPSTRRRDSTSYCISSVSALTL